MNKTKRFNFVIEPDTYEELERTAGKFGLPVGVLVRESITNLLSLNRRQQADFLFNGIRHFYEE